MYHIIGGRIYFDITTPSTSRTTGTGSSPSGTGDGDLGRDRIRRGRGHLAVRRAHANAGRSPTPSRPRCWSRRRSAASATTSTRNCSAGRRACRGGCGDPPGSRPAGYLSFTTFQPTFLYELIFDLALAAGLVWLGHHRGIKVPGLFALYVTGYSAFRIFEESLRVDPSEHFLGLRLNMYVAIAGTVAGGVWFWYTQRRGQGTQQHPGVAAVTAAHDGGGGRGRGRRRGRCGRAARRGSGGASVPTRVRRSPRPGPAR